MPTLMKKKKKVLNPQCSEALLGTVSAPKGLKRVNERVSEWVRKPDPGEDAVSIVFDLPRPMRRVDLKFHAR